MRYAHCQIYLINQYVYLLYYLSSISSSSPLESSLSLSEDSSKLSNKSSNYVSYARRGFVMARASDIHVLSRESYSSKILLINPLFRKGWTLSKRSCNLSEKDVYHDLAFLCQHYC